MYRVHVKWLDWQCQDMDGETCDAASWGWMQAGVSQRRAVHPLVALDEPDVALHGGTLVLHPVPGPLHVAGQGAVPEAGRVGLQGRHLVFVGSW